MLINCQKVENANNRPILQVINSSLYAVFKDDLNYEKFKLLVTDQAKFMLKVGEVLQHTFPNVKYITYLNHALHRVRENIRDDNPLIDKFKSLMKKFLLNQLFDNNCTKRKHTYHYLQKQFSHVGVHGFPLQYFIPKIIKKFVTL
jgi:hypothetical protein